MKISDITPIKEATTNLTSLAHQSTKKDPADRPFAYLDKSVIEQGLSPIAQKHNLYLDDVYFYPPNWTKNAAGEVIYIDPSKKDDYIGHYATPQEATTAYNNVITYLKQHLGSPIILTRGKQGSSKAFMVAYFIQRDDKSRPVIMTRWVKSIENANRADIRKNKWNWSGSAGADETGLHNETPLSVSESLPVKPTDVMETDTKLDASQAFDILKQNPTIQEELGDQSINQFENLAEFPWNAGTISSKGFYLALGKYFCENLHPLCLTKKVPVKINGLSDLETLSSKAFGSPDAYRKAKIVYPSSSSEGLYDSKLVLGNKEIILSSKLLRGSKYGTPTNTNTAMKRLTPEIEKELIQKYGDFYVKLFKIVASGTFEGDGSKQPAADHLIDIAKFLGVKTKDGTVDEAIGSAAKQFFNDAKDGKVNWKTIEKYPELTRFAKQPSRLQKHETKPENLLFLNLFDFYVNPVIQKITELPAIINYILNKSNFGMMTTKVSPEQFNPDVETTVTFEFKVPDTVKIALGHTYNPEYGGPIYGIHFKQGKN